MTVFEYGSGNSTLWWANQSKRVISVENNEEWYNKVKKSPDFELKKITYLLEKQKNNYVNSLNNNTSDIVVIDGSHRIECADCFLYEQISKNAILLIVDNSDRTPTTIKKIQKKLGWVQVDFHGFGPINAYTWTTTVFINPSKINRIKYLRPLKSVSKFINK